MATNHNLNIFVEENTDQQEVLDPTPSNTFPVPGIAPLPIPSDKGTLQFTIERIIFQNQDTGYCVLKGRTKKLSHPVTAVGTVHDARLGMEIKTWGEWIVHASYGQQFKIFGYEEALPTTTSGIEMFLASDLFEGIGPKIARDIVNAFGLQTFDILDYDPDRLSEIEGLGPVRIKKILDSWKERRKLREAMVFLLGHGVSTDTPDD